MKVLGFCDTHGDIKAIEHLKKIVAREKKKKKPIDVAVCCGDFTIFGQHMKRSIKKMNEIGVKVLVIPGNHEDGSNVRKECAKYKNLIYFDRDIVRFGDHVFLGYGSGGFAFRDATFLKWGKKMLGKLKKTDKVILAFHGPPYGTKLDVVISGHCGNKDYYKFIKKNRKKIYLVLAGHIHECFGEVEKKHSVVFANPTPYGMLFEIE